MTLELFLKDSKTISLWRQNRFGAYLDEFAKQLWDRGYNRHVAALHLRLIADFVCWTERNGLSEAEISSKSVQRYVRYRRRKRQTTGCDGSSITNFIQFLRAKHVLCGETTAQPLPREVVTDNYVRYLFAERALSPATITYHQEFVRAFLVNRFGDGSVNFGTLSAADVLQFVQAQAAKRAKRAKLMVTALRSFFRYLRYKGFVDKDLASVVPSIAQWSKASLPKSISSANVERVIASCRGSAAIERRDYATFLLLARLGLRAGEVVGLKLEDIDWQEGCLAVRGKGGVLTKMPLPVDVGEAIAEYLLEARPESKLRSVFLTVRAPVTAMAVCALSTRVSYALDALGIEAPSRGAHLFRHSLATNMLKGGQSLAEIAEILRHSSTRTTEVYAKVDLAALRQLALPWPGGVK